MMSLDCALIQSGWCPYKNGNVVVQKHQRKGHVRTQGENSHVQVEERGLQEKPPC